MNRIAIKNILNKISSIWQKKQVYVTTFPGKCTTDFNSGFEYDNMIPIRWVMPNIDDKKLVGIIHECIKQDLPRKLIDFGELDDYYGFNKLMKRHMSIELPPRFAYGNKINIVGEIIKKHFTIMQVTIQPLQTPANNIGDISRNFSVLLYEVDRQLYHLIDSKVYTHGGRWHLSDFKLIKENVIPDWVKTDEA